LADRVARSGAPVVAIDGPTGLDLTTGEPHGPVRADLTVTFGGYRRGHLLARDWCGRIAVIDIGFTAASPEWPLFVTDRWAGAVLPPIEVAMHKGNRGQVLVIGGETGMAGAVHYAARAALAVGAGLVRVATTAESLASLQSSLPDVTGHPTSLSGSTLEAGVTELLAWCDALVVGPGLGRSAARTAFVQAVLGHAGKPAVIDADALHAGREALTAGTGSRVLTPHLGEYRALTGRPTEPDFSPFEAAAATASSWSSGPGSFALLLKGVPTVVATDSPPSLVVGSGNPALATGGSGDLLSGFTGAFLARGLPPQVAAALGAQVLGRAAEAAARLHGVRSTRPSHILAAVPAALRGFQDSVGRDGTRESQVPVLATLDIPTTS
jgi:ADP-dependent NAD(P)H-hydrate dehydratase / NAD(P)H-hydrate epimerase